jgi:hypothetical protein
MFMALHGVKRDSTEFDSGAAQTQKESKTISVPDWSADEPSAQS